MSIQLFALEDYRSGLELGRYSPPESFCPYFEVDPKLYSALDTCKLRNRSRDALCKLRNRTSLKYYRNFYPLQARVLDYSARAFPAYRFILPEVMREDWLAGVDWDKFHRDHVVHQPLCGYVAIKLLSENPEDKPLSLPIGNTSILDVCVENTLRWEGTAFVRDFLIGCGMSDKDQILQANSPIARNVWRIFFQEAAYVAAVFHDLGYPWHYTKHISHNLDGVNAPVLKQTRNAQQIVEHFGHKFLFSALNGYQKMDAARPSTWIDRITLLVEAALTKTHGFPGALGFLHLNDCVRRYPAHAQSPLHLLCVEWVATAIMMHDMGKIYWGNGLDDSGVPENPFLRLSFRKDPLSSLVTLVDVIENFERSIVSFEAPDKPEDDTVRLTYDNDSPSTKLEIDASGTLTVSYQMKSQEDVLCKRSYLPGEQRVYFDPEYGYLDMSGLGITSVQLQASLAP